MPYIYNSNSLDTIFCQCKLGNDRLWDGMRSLLPHNYITYLVYIYFWFIQHNMPRRRIAVGKIPVVNSGTFTRTTSATRLRPSAANTRDGNVRDSVPFWTSSLIAKNVQEMSNRMVITEEKARLIWEREFGCSWHHAMASSKVVWPHSRNGMESANTVKNEPRRLHDAKVFQKHSFVSSCIYSYDLFIFFTFERCFILMMENVMDMKICMNQPKRLPCVCAVVSQLSTDSSCILGLKVNQHFKQLILLLIFRVACEKLQTWKRNRDD